MKRQRQLLLCASALALTACVQPRTISPKATEQEIQAEAVQHENYYKNEKAKGLVHVIEDKRPVTTRVKAVAGRIAPAAVKFCEEAHMAPDPRDCAFDIFIKSGKGAGALNAYADGQSIYITKSLVRFTRDDNELAFVIAHEMAHNLMHHSDAQRQNSLAGLLLGAVADAAVAKEGGYYTRRANQNNPFSKAGMQSGVLAYSTAFEQEADYIGLYLIARAGYDYHNVSEFWRRMSLENPEAIYVSTTHPTNPERYVVLRKDIQEVDSKKTAHLALLPQFVQQKNYSGY